jgi:glutathione-regulated potassium-efflux system ancillary protein KefC
VPWDALLTLVVALSMAVTPILLVVHDRLLARDARADRKADEIEPQSRDGREGVVIAGFGRVGQIVARLLLAAGHRPTILDFDPDQVEVMRRLGFRVFFGDAARLDLLESAGAARARLLVVAVDDVAASLRVVDIAREHFPKLEILARARNVGHHLELAKRDVRFIERETFEASLRVGRRALEILGDDPFEAREAADRFRAHNVATLQAVLPHLADEAKRFSVAKAAREQFEQQFARDRALADDMARAWSREDPAAREPAREDAET